MVDNNSPGHGCRSDNFFLQNIARLVKEREPKATPVYASGILWSLTAFSASVSYLHRSILSAAIAVLPSVLAGVMARAGSLFQPSVTEYVQIQSVE